MDVRFARNAGAVFSLKFHLVWCPKYRKQVLVPPVSERLEFLLREKVAEMELTIHTLEVMPDHVHLFVEADPRWCPAGIAARLKGYTSHVLRTEFRHLRSRLPTLWSRSYFVASIDSVTDQAIRKYIESQKGT